MMLAVVADYRVSWVAYMSCGSRYQRYWLLWLLSGANNTGICCRQRGESRTCFSSGGRWCRLVSSKASVAPQLSAAAATKSIAAAIFSDMSRDRDALIAHLANEVFAHSRVTSGTGHGQALVVLLVLVVLDVLGVVPVVVALLGSAGLDPGTVAVCGAGFEG